MGEGIPSFLIDFIAKRGGAFPPHSPTGPPTIPATLSSPSFSLPRYGRAPGSRARLWSRARAAGDGARRADGRGRGGAERRGSGLAGAGLDPSWAWSGAGWRWGRRPWATGRAMELLAALSVRISRPFFQDARANADVLGMVSLVFIRLPRLPACLPSRLCVRTHIAPSSSSNPFSCLLHVQWP